MALAPPFLTWIMLRMGWRSMFIVLGASGILVAVLWIALHRARRDTIHHEEDTASSGTVIPAEATQSRSVRSTASESEPAEAAWRVLLRQRAVWGMMLGWGGINYTVWLYLAWLPAYLEEQRHLPLATSGWIAALPFVAGAIGMLTSGALSDRLARTGLPLTTIHRRNLIGGMIVSASATFVVAHSQSTTQAVAGISAALFFIHFAGTSGWGYVQAISPLRYVASLGALQNFASFMIASAAPVITGWLLDRTHSFSIALGVCSAITLLGALSYATLAAPSGMHIEENA
jgi:cyanate permease